METPMTPGRALALLLAALACLAVVAGCGGDDDTGDDTQGTQSARLILDWFPNPDHAGIYAAVEEGFFEDEGVAVTPEVPSDPSAALKRLAAGRAEFAISYEPEVLIARSQGVPVVAVGALVTRPLNAVIYRTDRISGPDDLEGKTIGAAGLPSDRPLLDAVVRNGGGDPANVTVRNVGFNLSPALAGGRVDAVIGAFWNIELVELERQDQPVAALRLDEHGVPTYDELVVVTSDTIARERPDLVERFLRGLRHGQDWAATDQTGAVEHLLEANPDLDEDTVTAQLRETAEVLSPSDVPTLHVDPAQWAGFAAWMTENGLLEEPVDAATAVTDRFLPQDR
jgi:putative hydroxymethylpyrimidine transport system substrate-binding protein